MIAVPKVNRTEIATGNPSHLILYFQSANRYAPVKARAPVIENSYIFPQGTRWAETPRKITATSRAMKARTIITVPRLPLRLVRVKSNLVFASKLRTENATSIAWAINATAKRAIAV